jgi:hypothetical protein
MHAGAKIAVKTVGRGLAKGATTTGVACKATHAVVMMITMMRTKRNVSGAQFVGCFTVMRRGG